MLNQIEFIVTRPKASHKDIQLFEASLRVKLPAEFKEFCERFNGGCPSWKNNYYPVPNRFAGFRTEYGVGLKHIGVSVQDLLGILPEDDRFSISKKTKFYELHRKPFSNTIPVGTDGSGNTFLIRTGDRNFGEVSFFDNETEETYPIAERYDELFNGLRPRPEE